MSDTARGPRSREEVSQMIARWPQLDSTERDACAALLYGELRRLAQHYMRTERPGHTLQATALVHEAYLRLVEVDRMQWHDRAHFLAMAATTMRRILVDHARAHRRDKRGGGALVPLDVDVPAPEQDVDLLDLDRALARLAAIDPRQAHLVELRYFAGLTIEETAAALDVSTGTVKREWVVAKAWLYRELQALR